MHHMLEHPEIAHIERTGYPSWITDRDEDGDEDDYLDENWEDEYGEE